LAGVKVKSRNLIAVTAKRPVSFNIVVMLEFIDLKAQYQLLEKEIRERIDAVLQRGQYILGPEVTELEEKLAVYAGVKHCIARSSGTDALLLALMALGIGLGDAEASAGGVHPDPALRIGFQMTC
jgi:hypothetical protein